MKIFSSHKYRASKYLCTGFEIVSHLVEQGPGLLGVLLVADVAVSEADAEGGQEVHEEGAVEILAELVQHEPVAQLAVVEVVLDLDRLVRASEVSVHPHVDELVAHGGGARLQQPVLVL